MTREREGDLERICQEALELPVAQRADFLVEACGGDEGLRREAEALLAHDGAAASFLATPAMAMAARELDAGPALAAGQQFGPYTIVSRLGAGGMGEVYRARDPTLRRDVAIKVLPTLFTRDPERLGRFEREAQLLASLNHPNIATIHGLEHVAGIHALVLEVVEGETLAERLQSAAGHRQERAGLPLADALTIARQVAEALEAAHEQGVVHRDLKPANVKVRPDGVVKVLDFGLAKTLAVHPAVSLSPTAMATDTRVIVGTAAYMSPEQATGGVVDRRSDIFAFGSLLYEMLTGRRAFDGGSASEIMARVIEREPDWSALPTTTPPAVRRLLARCLDKDLRHRLQHIGDARVELEDALSGTPADPAATVAQPRSVVRLRSLAMIVSLAAVVAIGARLGNAWLTPQGGTQPRISRTSIASSGTAAVFEFSGLAITPDGTRIVYVGNKGTQLFVRPLAQLDATAVATGLPGSVFLSPDGQWIGFADRDTVKKVAFSGGPVTTIVKNLPGLATGGTWVPDDTIIFAGQDLTTGLLRVSASGGEAKVLTRPDQKRGELDHLWPEILPSGRAVLFTITATAGGLDAAQVAVLDLVNGEHHVLVRGGRHARYVPSGHLVYEARGRLDAIPFDLDRLETRGTAVGVERLVGSQQGISSFDVAADGKLVYIDVPDQASSQTLVWADRQGREDQLGVPPGSYSQPRVSPDGTKVAVISRGDIWVWDLARRRIQQFTSDSAPQFAPVWTADGRHLLFFWAGRPFSLFRQLADGTGAAEPLSTGGEGNLQPSAVTKDGRVLATLGGRDLLVLTLDGTRRAEPLLQTELQFEERNGVVSPDDRWLAYESDSSGRVEIYVRPFPNTSAGPWPITTAGGTRPLFAPDGQELFYVALDGALMAVPIDPRAGTWSAGSPTKVLQGSYATITGLAPRTYDVSRDGQRFLMVKEAPAAQVAAPQIIVVQPWLEELKRLVPVN